MAINWSSGGSRFSFGNLDAAQQTLYEDNPALAWQRLMGYYAQGNPNFATTTFGRYIQSQMQQANNDYLAKSSEQTARFAQNKQSWSAQQESQRASLKAAADKAGEAYYGLAWSGLPAGTDTTKLPEYAAWQAAQKAYNDFNPGEWQNPEQQLTWTRYLEQNPAAMGEFAQQFNMLPSAQRGANPGAFQVRRNLW